MQRAAPAIDRVTNALTQRHEIMSDMREYERACTTVANAFVQTPVGGPLVLITSGGGTFSTQTALSHPVRLIESGPAAKWTRSAAVIS